MKIEVISWAEVPEREIEGLFSRNPFPLYRGTPLANDSMKEYMFMLAKESATLSEKNAMVALVDGNPVLTGQVYQVPYLSRFWNKPIGSLGHLITDRPNDETTLLAARPLIENLLVEAKKDKISFLSLSVPAPSIMLIRALEERSFRYAEGFLNMVGPTNAFREAFSVPGMTIRDLVESDFGEIAQAFHEVPFPSRFTTDPGFESKRALDLYVHRFREVHEQGLGKVFVAEIEGQFAGALIAIIDEKMAKMIGVKTNPLSGMGIIIHPRASRRGVSLALIEHRQDYYKSEGVQYVNFGANFNNMPMIRGLAKLGLGYGSIDTTFHQWIDADNRH